MFGGSNSLRDTFRGIITRQAAASTECVIFSWQWTSYFSATRQPPGGSLTLLCEVHPVGKFREQLHGACNWDCAGTMQVKMHFPREWNAMELMGGCVRWFYRVKQNIGADRRRRGRRKARCVRFIISLFGMHTEVIPWLTCHTKPPPLGVYK